MCHGRQIPYHEINEYLNTVPGTLVTYCKAMCGSVVRACDSGYGCNDRRPAIEALALRQSMSAAKTVLRWVHSGAMIADGWTKLEAPAHMQ